MVAGKGIAPVPMEEFILIVNRTTAQKSVKMVRNVFFLTQMVSKPVPACILLAHQASVKIAIKVCVHL